MKKLKYLFFLLPFLSYSQIAIDYTANKINNSRKIFLSIKITNESGEKYAIPIDTTGFRVYYRDESCSNFFFGGADRGLGLTVLFSNKGEYQNGQSGGGYINEENFDKQSISTQTDNYQRQLEKWKTKYNIKVDSIAEKNKYFFESIILLNPRQAIEFKAELDPNLFNQDENLILFNTYYLQPEKQYLFSLYHCIDVKSYQVLTHRQKKELYGYRLFSGNIKSQEIQYSFTEGETNETIK